jgi:hypothetical protein
MGRGLKNSWLTASAFVVLGLQPADHVYGLPSHRVGFATTHWSLALHAGESDSPSLIRPWKSFAALIGRQFIIMSDALAIGRILAQLIGGSLSPITVGDVGEDVVDLLDRFQPCLVD